MPTLAAKTLHEITARIFASAGVSVAVADQVARSLVEANLVGHDSHGVIRIKEYLKAIKERRILPAAQPAIVRETETTLTVDGGHGFGQVVAAWTMERIIEKAAQVDLAAAGIFHCGHVGRLGVYVTTAAQKGFIALAFVNGGANEPRVAPHGGRRPIFGTNPLAAALPSADSSPVVIDFSTAIVAAGKIRVARDKGELLPEGWILDAEGRPSRKPEDYYSGGMLLTAAGHKGYGLAILVEALAGLLSGAGSAVLDGCGRGASNGVFFTLIRAAAFCPADAFETQMAQLGQAIKAIPPLTPGQDVLLPGEPEQMTLGQRLKTGIAVPDFTWKAISEAAASVELDLASMVQAAS